jgi:nucleoside-diphosphate-sugar epimerase
MMNKQEILMTSGEQNFDTIHVDDCARAYVAITNNGIGGVSYCVGSGHPKKLKEYVMEMLSIFPGSTIKFGAVELNDEILPLETFDTSKLIEDTGFKSKYSFAESVKQLSRYLK